jgi:hypothetical protein
VLFRSCGLWRTDQRQASKMWQSRLTDFIDSLAQLGCAMGGLFYK